MKTTVNVEGMMCQNCVRKITDKLMTVPGISKVDASVDEKTVTVSHDGRDGIDKNIIDGIEILEDGKFSVVRG